MKRLLLILILLCFTLSCAPKQAPIDYNYLMYALMKMKANKHKEKPNVIQEFEDGQLVYQEIHHPQPETQLETKKQEIHPGWNLAGKFVDNLFPMLGWLGGAYILGDTISDIATNNKAPNVNGSYNTAGDDFNLGVNTGAGPLDFDSAVTTKIVEESFNEHTETITTTEVPE